MLTSIKLPIAIAMVVIGIILLTTGVLSQPSPCGAPPPVADEVLKAELEGRAKLLSKFLGGASLSGQIEMSQAEIFSRYPNDFERSNAYFQYQVCVLLMKDRTMSVSEKIRHLEKIQAHLRNPMSKASEAETGNKSPVIQDIDTGGGDLNVIIK